MPSETRDGEEWIVTDTEPVVARYDAQGSIELRRGESTQRVGKSLHDYSSLTLWNRLRVCYFILRGRVFETDTVQTTTFFLPLTDDDSTD